MHSVAKLPSELLCTSYPDSSIQKKRLCLRHLVPQTWLHLWPVSNPLPGPLGFKGLDVLALAQSSLFILYTSAVLGLEACAQAGAPFMLPFKVTLKRG